MIRRCQVPLKVSLTSTALHQKDCRPVRAGPVHHPRVKTKTSVPPLPLPSSLHGLDAGWCGTLGPHRKGTRLRRWRQTANRRDTQGNDPRLARMTWGPFGAAPASRATFLPPDTLGACRLAQVPISFFSARLSADHTGNQATRLSESCSGNENLSVS